jgi:hypothetical protein
VLSVQQAAAWVDDGYGGVADDEAGVGDAVGVGGCGVFGGAWADEKAWGDLGDWGRGGVEQHERGG